MKPKPVRRQSRYSRLQPRRTFRYHSLRRIARAAVAEEQREAARGHLVYQPHYPD